MTFMIAGKMHSQTFLMADCKVKLVGGKPPIFSDKVLRLESSENTYCSLAGTQFMYDCIQSYDTWLTSQDQDNDFLTGDRSIYELLAAIQRFRDKYPFEDPLLLKKNRLFFITYESVVYYDLFYNEMNELEFQPERCPLEIDSYVDSNLAYDKSKIDMNELAVRDYCFDHLSNMPYSSFSKNNRYTFLLFYNNRNLTLERPYKNFSDIIISYYKFPYNCLDQDVWNF